MPVPVIDEYLAHLVRLNRRPTTIYQRRRTLVRLAEFLDPVELLDANVDQLRAYTQRESARGGPLGDEARYGDVSRMMQFFRWAVREGHLDVDPTMKLERPHRARRLPNPMPRRDVEKAINEAPEPLRTWFWLAYRAGLRACEIAPIRSGDIRGGLLVIREQKGGGQGVVPVSPGLLEAITPHLRTKGYWFPHGAGNPNGRSDPSRHITPNQLQRRANRWLHDNGIEHTLHTLRHRFGTDIYRLSGHDLLLTAELLRHVKLDTTRGYAALAPERAVEVVTLADDFGTAA